MPFRHEHKPLIVLIELDLNTSPGDGRRADQLGAAMYVEKPTQLATFVTDIGSAVKTSLGIGNLKVNTQGG